MSILLLLVLVLLFFPGATDAAWFCQSEECQTSWTPVPNMVATLVGYNPMIGNRYEKGKSDPGMRNQIFSPTSVREKDGRFDVSKNLHFSNAVNCLIETGSLVIKNYQQYRDRKISAFSFAERSEESFSLNIPFLSFLINYEKTEAKVMSTRTVSKFEVEKNFFDETSGEIYINEARCELYKVAVDAFETPIFTPSFISGMRALHRAAVNPESRRSKRNLKRFISNFGTHYQAESWLGATLTTETRFASGSKSDDERKTRKNCVRESYRKAMVGALGGWGVNSEEIYANESEKCLSSNNVNSFYSKNRFKKTSIISVGSPPLRNVNDWAKSAKEHPSVIRFKLKTISDLFRSEWINSIAVDPKSEEFGNLDGNLMYGYFEEALSNYCETMLGQTCPKSKDCGVYDLCDFDQECVDGEFTSACEKGML